MSELPDTPGRGAPRVTPYELIFGAPSFDEARFEAVRAEAAQMAAQSSAELFMLPAAGELLQAMTPAAGGMDAVAQVRALIHAAYRFWLADRHVYRIPEPMLRDLLADTGAAPALPQPAGYVQLPRNAIWARVSAAAAPEPIDGFFWCLDGAPDGPLELLFALGVRAGRPGVSLFDVRLETVAQLEHWGSAKVRDEGDDFANVLPGGELQGYLALTSAAEGLKLAALCLARVGAGAWSSARSGTQHVHEPADG
jgi:hypothetical protein